MSILRLLYLTIGLSLAAEAFVVGGWAMQQIDTGPFSKVALVISLWAASLMVEISMVCLSFRDNWPCRLPYICFVISGFGILLVSGNLTWMYLGPAIMLLMTMGFIVGPGWWDDEWIVQFSKRASPEVDSQASQEITSSYLIGNRRYDRS